MFKDMKTIQQLDDKYFDPVITKLNPGFWLDGICNECGQVIVQQSVANQVIADYMNMCSNMKCKQHKWHYCFDTDFLQYYTHGNNSLLYKDVEPTI